MIVSIGKVNVDVDLLNRSIEGDEAGIIDRSNGCVCCQLQDDLLIEVAHFAEMRAFDTLLVELSGNQRTDSVARTFAEGVADGDNDPTDHHRLDTMMAVISEVIPRLVESGIRLLGVFSSDHVLIFDNPSNNRIWSEPLIDLGI